MKHLINAKERIVTDSIEGLLAGSYGPALTRLDGFPDIKVVVRKDWDKSRVAVISGGGSGHEPAHAGYVGRGMLTAAVCGEIFASPSVDAVLAAIVAVTGAAGCLLVVKNYTGDRLNFGLAAEKAKRMGYRVEMVIVADDIALPGSAQPRGIAGTVLVHKVAGCQAESGASLEQVKQAAGDTAAAIVSLGLALSACSVPGQAAEARLLGDEAELGLGIHGEPGAQTVPLQPLQAMVSLLLERLEQALPAGDEPLGLLVNNLGSIPAIEMGLIVREVMVAPLASRIALVFGPAPLMTALDMRGFSLSLVRLTDARRQALLEPVEPRAWCPGVRPETPEILPLPSWEAASVFPASADPATRAVVERLCRVLIEQEAALNAQDAKIGDGDTGTTFASAARSILGRLDELPLAQPERLLQALGELLSRAMGGSSGVLASIFFTAAGSQLARRPDWAEALQAGIGAMQSYGGAQAGDRTLLDALIPAVASLAGGGDLSQAAAAARTGAAATAQLDKARAGRASYISADRLHGVEDPGAQIIALIFSALARS